MYFLDMAIFLYCSVHDFSQTIFISFTFFIYQDISNLAPRKPDWDLKRDIAKKLEILERRTQKAIAEEVRTRLKQGQQNLAAYVNDVNKE